MMTYTPRHEAHYLPRILTFYVHRRLLPTYTLYETAAAKKVSRLRNHTFRRASWVTPTIAADTRYLDAAPPYKRNWLAYAKLCAQLDAIFSRDRAAMYTSHAYEALALYVYDVPRWYGTPDAGLERWYYWQAWLWLARGILKAAHMEVRRAA